MDAYREIAPPPQLADRVECIWITSESQRNAEKRVLPDGCADIIYMRENGQSSLRFVGSMTHYADFRQAESSVGIRLRPGMWHDLLRVNGTEVADRLVSLDQLWGKQARELAVRLDNVDKPVEMGRLLADALPLTAQKEGGIRLALNAIERSRGRFPLGLAAERAGYCSRQFRRRCLEVTGLQPKLLIRILRFRHAVDSIASRPGNYAALAFECGYSDQSHLIADFKEFAGQTPREMALRFSSRESRPEHLACRSGSV